MMTDFAPLWQNFDSRFFLKLLALTIIGLYGIFAFMLATKIRSFNKILFLPARSGVKLMQAIATIYAAIVALFFLLALIVL